MQMWLRFWVSNYHTCVHGFKHLTKLRRTRNVPTEEAYQVICSVLDQHGFCGIRSSPQKLQITMLLSASKSVLLIHLICTSNVIAYKHPLIKEIQEETTINLPKNTPNPTSAPENSPVRFGVSFYRYGRTWCSPKHYHHVRHDAIMHIVSLYSGFRCSARRPPLESTRGGRSLEGGYTELIDGKIDIYVEPTYYRTTYADNVSFLYPHEHNNICLMVPKAPKVFLSMASTVSLPLWVATGAAFAAFVAAAWAVARLGPGGAVVEVLRTIITGAFDDRRLRLLVWLSALSFFLSNTIGGNLTGSIVAPGSFGELDTLEEVDSMVKEIFIPWWFVSNVKDIGLFGETLASLASKFRTEYKIEDLITSRTYAFLADMYTNILWERHLQATEKKCSVVHHVKDCVLSPSFLSFAVRKDWPRAQRFDSLLQRIVEAGLPTRLGEHELFGHLRGEAFGCGVAGGEDPPDPVRPLLPLYLREAFALLLAGALVAILAFCGERRARPGPSPHLRSALRGCCRVKRIQSQAWGV